MYWMGWKGMPFSHHSQLWNSSGHPHPNGQHVGWGSCANEHMNSHVLTHVIWSDVGEYAHRSRGERTVMRPCAMRCANWEHTRRIYDYTETAKKENVLKQVCYVGHILSWVFLSWKKKWIEMSRWIIPLLLLYRRNWVKQEVISSSYD